MGDLSGRAENLCMQHLGRGTVPAVTAEAATAKDTLPSAGWHLLCHRTQNLLCWGRSAGTTWRCKVKGAVLGIAVCQSVPTHHERGTSPAWDGMAKPCPGTWWLVGTPGAKHWHLLGHYRLSSGAPQGAKYLWEKSPSAGKAALYFCLSRLGSKCIISGS